MTKPKLSVEDEKATLVNLEAEILSWGGREVTALEVYSDIFDIGTGLIQKRGEEPLTSKHRSELRSQEDYKTNPIARYKYPYVTKDGTSKTYMRERVLFDDTFASGLAELQEKDFAILGGLSYFGRSNKVKNANKMHAMIFDLDGQTPVTMRNFLQGAFMGGAYPVPNYIALSGHGAHLYYVFEYPIPLYPDLKDKLNTYKDELTKGIWNFFTSEEEIQSQGINQGFRIIGGKTKIDGYRVKAFRINETPFNLEMLNEFVPEEVAIDETKLWESWSQEEKRKKLTFQDAVKAYPGWYEEFVKPYEDEQAIREQKGLDRQKRRKVSIKGWRVKGDKLYNWWLKKMQEGAKFGNRHNCVMVLAAIAKKSDPNDVPYERLIKDAYDLMPFLNSLSSDEPFTEDDLKHALKTYDDNYLVLSVKGINKLTKINIQKTRRNYRKQAVHLQRVRVLQNLDNPDGDWRNKDGRPKGSGTKESIVREFIANNPDKNVTQIARELGVSRPTVYKYKKGV